MKKEIGITKQSVKHPEDTKEAMRYCEDNGYNPPFKTTMFTYSTMVTQMTMFANEKNSELLERYNEAIEVLEEVNKDLIVLHGNIYQELKKGNSQWEGVDEIIFKRIEVNKQTISKANP